MGEITANELARVNSFPKLIEILEHKLDWPIQGYDLEDLIYEYEASELGLKPEETAKVREIHQLRPLATNQPWGIFFLSFEKKAISVTVLRRILRSLVVKKRSGTQAAERQAWNKNDLIFAANFGKSGERELAFVHFSDGEATNNLPVMKVLGWNAKDTKLHNEHAGKTLSDKLHWPDDPADQKAWRAQWSSAFDLRHNEVIQTSRDLAIRLAELAQEIRARANQLMHSEAETGPLRTMHEAFRKNLIQDLDEDGFADMFAQTICYGMLAAAFSKMSGDPAEEDSGMQAVLVADNIADMVPRTNPFLKELFENFLKLGGRDRRRGMDFDELGVADVVDMLNRANMAAVKRDFGNRNPKMDPVIHFYEDFLHEYDRDQKVDAGVFYTPPAVVNFIVRGVDEMLRTEFDLPLGLADTTSWKKLSEIKPDITIPKGVDPDTPFVQILDPATGTGTFLVEVIDLVHKRLVEFWRRENRTAQEIRNSWNVYVSKFLLPRLTAFELKMAAYAIAHLKIGLKLTETGYEIREGDRARILLTNSLQPAKELDLEERMRLEALAHEAERANEAKEKTAFTVVIGNPPYKGHSMNPSKVNGKLTLAGELIQRFFQVRGEPLNERNPKWLNNDYVKFIAFAMRQIEQSGAGVLGYITSNSWLDSPTFRGVRTEVMDGFPMLRIVDLHGNIKKKETAPDGSKDEGVFAIEEGTNITIAGKIPTNLEIKQTDLLGTLGVGSGDKGKLTWLEQNSLEAASNPIHPLPPIYQLTPMEGTEGGTNRLMTEFYALPSLKDIQPLNGVGVISKRDGLSIDMDANTLLDRVQQFQNTPEDKIHETFGLPPDVRDWRVEWAKADIEKHQAAERYVKEICYRPFDRRFIYYTGVARGFIGWPTDRVMRHMSGGDNLGLVTTRQCKDNWDAKVVGTMIGHKALNDYDVNSLLPLWLKPSVGESHRRPNIDQKFAETLCEAISLGYEDGIQRGRQESLGSDNSQAKPEQLSLEKAAWHGRGDLNTSFGPRDLFDWIYAVLHAPSYRTRYAEFLKSDFPRIPTPGSVALFRALVPLGAQLVALHLLKPNEAAVLENPAQFDPAITFNGTGEARVEKGYPNYENGKVMINASRWFEDVPKETWEFHVGGYQVCQRWLKDRASKGGKKPSPGRVLTDEDILHYRRVVVALTETHRIMAEIDKVIEAHGGWPDAFDMPPPPPPTIEEILQADEGQDLEFKSTLQFDMAEKARSKFVRKAALKTIAAFLNSDSGVLAIGVGDDKNIIGLDPDFSLMSEEKRNQEWYQQTLVNLINDQIGKEFAKCYEIRFGASEAKEVCIVEIKKRAPNPVYLTEGGTSEFYVRTSNKTIQLKGDERDNYIRTHWKNQDPDS